MKFREQGRKMRTNLALLLVISCLNAWAGNSSDPAAAELSLAQLAAKADLIVLAQARDTDYFLRREIPVSGSAYLKVLIPYKVDRPVDIVEVYEKGLHNRECYFPNPTVFEEGRRYLLFLRRDPEDEARYRGLTEGCALEVLVNDENRYALRYPVTGIRLSDPLENHVSEMQFHDPYAVVADESLPPAQREAMLAAGQIVPYKSAGIDSPGDAGARLTPNDASGRRWIYTRGISLGAVRELMGPQGHTPDRHIKKAN